MNRITYGLKSKVATEINVQLKEKGKSCITNKELFDLLKDRIPKYYQDTKYFTRFRTLVKTVLEDMPEFESRRGKGIIFRQYRKAPPKPRQTNIPFTPSAPPIEPIVEPIVNSPGFTDTCEKTSVDVGDLPNDISFAVIINGVSYGMTLKDGHMSMTINRQLPAAS